MGDSAGGACGKLFLITNFLLWLIGFGTLGYAIWIMVSSDNTSNFLSGTLVFTYSFMGVGILLVLIGLFGCIGGCAESTCCLKAYIGLMTVLLLVDIGVVIAGVIQRDQIFDITSNLWDEINTETKDQIQNELKCCGHSSPAEYGGSLPNSCLQNDNDPNSVYTTACKDAMKDWVESEIPIWASILGAVFLIQIISMIASCLTLKNIEDANRIHPM